MASSVRTQKLGIHRNINRGKLDSVFKTTELYNRVIDFYQSFLRDRVSVLEQIRIVTKVNKKNETITKEEKWTNKDILTFCETHTLATKAHPNPMRLIETDIPETKDMPTDVRRSAINKAIGKVRSWHSNHQNWLALEPSKRKREPQLGASNDPLTFYGTQYDLQVQTSVLHQFVQLRLYHEGKWQMVSLPVTLHMLAKEMIQTSMEEEHRIKQAREEAKKLFSGKKPKEYPEEWRKKLQPRQGIWMMQSPTLYIYSDRRGKSSPNGVRLSLNIPFEMKFSAPDKAEKQRLENPKMAVTTVDLGVNNLAAMINWLEHKVQDTLFISGEELNHKRKQRLHTIHNKRMVSGRMQKGISDNIALWRKVRNVNDAAAWQVARRIVAFAKSNDSKVIVFEFLRTYKAPKGRMSKASRKNHKQGYWLRGKMMERTRELAFREGILVAERNPAYTSQTCPKCQHIGNREKHSFSCSCGWKGNADFVGAYNLYWKWQRTFRYIKRAA